MTGSHFRLTGLFGAVAFVATACGALTNPTPAWTWFVVGATLCILTYSLLAAIFRRREMRAFWIGFAIVGWGYLLLVAHDKLAFGLPMRWDNYGRVTQEQPAHLVTTELLVHLSSYMGRKTAPPEEPVDQYAAGYQQPAATRAAFESPVSDDSHMDIGRPYRLFRIGQYIFTILFGALSGVVSRSMYVKAGQF